MSVSGLNIGLPSAYGLYGRQAQLGSTPSASNAHVLPSLGNNSLSGLNAVTGGSPIAAGDTLMGLLIQTLNLTLSLLTHLLGGTGNPPATASFPATAPLAQDNADSSRVLDNSGNAGTAGDAGNAGNSGGPGNAGDAARPIDKGAAVNADTGNNTRSSASNGPTSIMDLSQFSLQLPTGSDGSPDTVKGPDLGRYNSQYFKQENGKLVFYAPANGVHTAHSSYPRSELSQNNGWKLASGPHSLSATTSVDQAPSSKDIVIGQLHEKSIDGAKPRPPIELHWKNGSVVASVLQSDSLTAPRRDVVIADNVPLGKQFSYNMQVSPSGDVQISADGQSKSVQLDPSFSRRELYFKAGSYVQDNQGGANDGGQVSFYGLNMT